MLSQCYSQSIKPLIREKRREKLLPVTSTTGLPENKANFFGVFILAIHSAEFHIDLDLTCS